MPDDRKHRAVPTGRLERLFGLGVMAGSIGARVALAGASNLLSGKPPALSDLLLAPVNALRVADQLSQMRGAAMKLGQLLSMDAGQVLPPEWSTILARLQADAAPMPAFQLERQLVKQWGAQWRDEFEHFSMSPIAAASIGQVHRGKTRSGTDVAVKVQYPGDGAAQRQAMLDIGYFTPQQHRLATLAMDLLAMRMTEVMAEGLFDFTAADLPRRARDLALAAGFSADLFSIPPIDTLFVHRKIGGMYLLASKLGAKIDMRALLAEFADGAPMPVGV